MIVVCRLGDVQKWRKWIVAQNGKEPHIYRTTIGNMPFEDLPFFHPTWDLVLRAPSPEAYLTGYENPRTGEWVTGYYDLLKSRSPACFAFVRSLCADENYLLLCFCREGAFCHRQIIADKIEKYRPDLGNVIRH